MRFDEVWRAGRIRNTVWANPNAYLKLDLMDDGTAHGPWGHLYDRRCQEHIGEPTPQTVLLHTFDGGTGWVEYSGPLDKGDVAP